MKSYQLLICPPVGDGVFDAEVKLTTSQVGHPIRVVARVALWWRDTPSMDGEKVGAIGEFTADDSEAAALVLKGAMNHLREQGCRLAVGPLNGNTWQPHRFVVESNGRGTFVLEPRNSLEYPGWWESAGFSVLSRYSSSVIALNGPIAISAAVRSRLVKAGVVVRAIDLSRYDDELRVIYAISLKSFTANFLYTSLEESAFLGAYQKVRDQVDASLIQIAECDGRPCGFVFGIPDLEALRRGERPALIVKTLAVDSEARCPGLGNLLVEELHRSGREKGYTEAIHALQHESNRSLKITGRHHGEVFRRYALFSKLL